MCPPASETSSRPSFTLALRRNPGTPVHWRLRFEVTDGAFVLRTRSAGMDLDGPPLSGGSVDIGPEDAMDSLRLRLLDARGDRVAVYRVTQRQQAPDGSWTPLRPAGCDEDGTLRLLPPDATDDVDAEAGPADLLEDLPDNATPARLMKHLRRELDRTRVQVETLSARLAALELERDERHDPSETTLVP